MDKDIDRIIEDPQDVDIAMAERMAHSHPYFIYPAVAALKSGTAGSDERKSLKQRLAAHIGDMDTLLDMFGADGDIFADFYPDMHAATPSTDETIDNFLSRFGGGAMQPDPLDFAPAVDYAAILEAEERGETLPGAAFDKGSETKVDRAASEETDHQGEEGDASRPAESAALSESLARIMIKNKNYEKALEIILALSLNNPEKSIYFADQIRFLKKLILNKNS